MPLRLTVCPAHAVERLAARGDVDEILAVMPRSECDEGGAFCRWPDVTVPRTVIEVSDLGWGDLVPEAEIEAIVAEHPTILPPRTEHAVEILRVARRALRRSGPENWHLLVHCNAGLSRSVAAALLILALDDGPGLEEVSVARLREVTGDPAPSPNLNLILHGDRLLGREGRLLAACAPSPGLSSSHG